MLTIPSKKEISNSMIALSRIVMLVTVLNGRNAISASTKQCQKVDIHKSMSRISLQANMINKNKNCSLALMFIYIKSISFGTRFLKTVPRLAGGDIITCSLKCSCILCFAFVPNEELNSIGHF